MEVLPSCLLGKLIRSRPTRSMVFVAALVVSGTVEQPFETTWFSKRMVTVEGDCAVLSGIMPIVTSAVDICFFFFFHHDGQLGNQTRIFALSSRSHLALAHKVMSTHSAAQKREYREFALRNLTLPREAALLILCEGIPETWNLDRRCVCPAAAALGTTVL